MSIYNVYAVRAKMKTFAFYGANLQIFCETSRLRPLHAGMGGTKRVRASRTRRVRETRFFTLSLSLHLFVNKLLFVAYYNY